MGVYLNPGAEKFLMDRKMPIYVDKSMIIHELNGTVLTGMRYLCVSRPRRFGKTMAVDMISAYYDKTQTAEELFQGLRIISDKDFQKYCNRFDVIKINMQEFLSESKSMAAALDLLKRSILWELLKEYPDTDYFDSSNLTRSMNDLFTQRGLQFVILIDEWDCVFREYPRDEEGQKIYLDFLRDWLKDKAYVALAYYSARQYYNLIREFPAGKGFADLLFLPRVSHPEVPAMVVELKWDQSADTAVSQIIERQYPNGLTDYQGTILLVGISYDRKTRKHACKIVSVSKE